jgi:hypothetical protein
LRHAGYAGEEACFSNVQVTPAEPQPIANAGEASGSWAVEFASDYGKYTGSMELRLEGNTLKVTWSDDWQRPADQRYVARRLCRAYVRRDVA